MVKEFILLFFIIICIIYYTVSAGPSRHLAPTYLSPEYDYSAPSSPLRERMFAPRVGFDDEVLQRKYSKKSGRVVGADVKVPINDLVLNLSSRPLSSS
jgi:hypothetical protein